MLSLVDLLGLLVVLVVGLEARSGAGAADGVDSEASLGVAVVDVGSDLLGLGTLSSNALNLLLTTGLDNGGLFGSALTRSQVASGRSVEKRQVSVKSRVSIALVLLRSKHRNLTFDLWTNLNYGSNSLYGVKKMISNGFSLYELYGEGIKMTRDSP